MRLKELIAQPYPYTEGDYPVMGQVGRSLLIGLFITVFLLVFQPFGISQWQASQKTAYLIGFGVVTFLCLLVMKLGILRIFHGFFQEKGWTVGREILYNLAILILLTLGNFLYAWQIGIIRLSFPYFLWSLFSVVTVGVFPITFGVLTKYRRALVTYAGETKLTVHQQPDEAIEVFSENGKDKLRFSVNELLYIESADNYSKLVFADRPAELIRGSLSRIESQVSHPQVLRCHRSYIVNLNKVRRISGNAQGYKLSLTETAEIPVARKYAELVQGLRSRVADMG